MIAQNEEVNSTVSRKDTRKDTTLVGNDEVENSDLDYQLINTDFKNTHDKDSDNNFSSDEENNDNEEEDDEDDSQVGNIIAAGKRTNTDETPFDTGDTTETVWERIEIQPPFLDTYPISRVLYTLPWTLLRKPSPSSVNPSYSSTVSGMSVPEDPTFSYTVHTSTRGDIQTR